MKNKLMIMMVGMLMVCLLPAAASAQNTEFKSTSSMRGTGNYVAPVTAVGANSAVSEATTTGSYSPSKVPSGRRKIDTAPGQDGGHSDEGSPVGDVWPLAIFALAMAIVIGIKRNVNPKIEKQ